ncbi:hypothetical protein AB0J63_47175 [Streptosporangium canum]|uniref:hypothetical protein n=1 Tax=Streptosporangium canum TaxID=324952 RepID=UPI003425D388
MNTSHNWSENERFPGHLSRSNPALAEFHGRLYAAHRGDRDESLWWTVYDPGENKGWSDDTYFPAHRSADGPALAVYNNFMYCVHRGGGNDQHLWWTRFNGTSWSADTRLPDHMSAQGPALVSYREPYGTEDQLFCVHRGHG